MIWDNRNLPMNPEFGWFLHFDPSFHSWLHTTYMASNPMQIVSLCLCMYCTLNLQRLFQLKNCHSFMAVSRKWHVLYLNLNCSFIFTEDHAIGLSTFTVMAGLGGNYLFYFTIVMTWIKKKVLMSIFVFYSEFCKIFRICLYILIFFQARWGTPWELSIGAH